MELTGKVIFDLPLQEGISKAGNNWKKKEWVLEFMSGQYPRKAKFQAFGDRVDRINMELGKTYTVKFDVESREYNGRWYTDLNAYDATEAAEQAPSFSTPAPVQAPSGSPFPSSDPFGAAPTMPVADETDDLPF